MAYPLNTPFFRPLPKPGCWEIGFRQISFNFCSLLLPRSMVEAVVTALQSRHGRTMPTHFIGFNWSWLPIITYGVSPEYTFFRPLPEPGCWEIGFRQISLKISFSFINDAHKQYSLLDTMFIYIFLFGLPEKHLWKVKKTYYMSAGSAGRHVVGFGNVGKRRAR